MGRKLLWSSLALAPVAIVVHLAFHPGGTVDFVLASAALVPLAWLIGEATEQAAHHTGPGIGGFLNATFGNAPELIIALFAVSDGLFEVVRGSLSGSVIGNLLLVLGFSLLFGGRGELDRVSAFVSVALVAVAVLLFLIPAVPAFGLADPDEGSRYAYLSLGPSVVLLVLYLVVTYQALRRHRELHIGQPTTTADAWPMSMAVGVLGVATVVTAVTAEILVGSVEEFGASVGLSDFFVAAVIIAIVGNAAEHGGAVVVAARGQIKLAAEIALASSAQVAVFLIPAVALLAWAIDPLALAFREVELVVLAGAVVLTAALVADGRSSRAKGLVLIAAYAGAAVAFFAAGDR